MMRKFIPAFIISLASFWAGWTLLVDFFIVPTIFRSIEDFFQAGLLGIALFSKLNNLELITSTGLLALSALSVRRGKSGIVAFVLSLALWSIAMFYFAFLTPKITQVTGLWQKADLMGLPGLPGGVPDLQQEHQFWHRLYIGIDSVKLGLLVTLMAFGIFRGEDWK